MNGSRVTRRVFVTATSALALVPFGCKQQDGTLVADPDFADLVEDELLRATERGTFREEAAKLLRANKNWATDATVRPTPTWPPPMRHIDYSHLVEFAAPPETFAISAEVLQWLADRNSFLLASNEPVVMFGLRGCSLVDAGADSTNWASSHQVRLATPDHASLQCVVGVWRRTSQEIRLFKGSTVPEAGHVWASRNLAGSGAKGECNLQPTGLYEYVAGSHAATGKFPQHGALRQPTDQPIVVLRSPNDITFDPTSPTEVWQLGYFANNFHSACRMSGVAPLFSSAGCQIVAGSYHLEPPESTIPKGTRPRGAWSEFRVALGLQEAATPHNNEHPDRDRRFKYILLTGLEAALCASGEPNFRANYRRIRFGSQTSVEGSVGLLQQRLGLAPTGRMDAVTVLAQITALKKAGTFETGVVVV